MKMPIGERHCECYRHTRRSILEGKPGRKCFQYARKVLKNASGDVHVCNECYEQIRRLNLPY